MSAYNAKNECKAYYEEKYDYYEEKYEADKEIVECKAYNAEKDCCAKDISNQEADELAKMETYKIMLKHLKS